MRRQKRPGMSTPSGRRCGCFARGSWRCTAMTRARRYTERLREEMDIATNYLMAVGLQCIGRSRRRHRVRLLASHPTTSPIEKKVLTCFLTPMQPHKPLRKTQYTLESLSAVRVQRAWRGHRVVRVLRDVVTKQVVALRIQRFMRKWRRRNVELALRLVFASALELR